MVSDRRTSAILRLDESDLLRLGRRGAVEAMRSFLRSTAEGRAQTRPCLGVPLGARTLVFNVGSDEASGVAGFRLYSVCKGSCPGPAATQMLGLLDLGTGEVLATAVGDAFGAWRTAALGGLALEESLPAEDGAVAAAVIGAGRQAHHQARTWAALGRVASFRVVTRSLEAASAFAADLARDTGLPATAVATTAEALRGARAVLCATTSTTPVFAPRELDPDAFVATLGPKYGVQAEVPPAVFAAAFLLTDAPAQVAEHVAMRGPLPGDRRPADVVPLTEVVAGRLAVPPRGVRLFVSEGLAGTEVALLEAVRRAVSTSPDPRAARAAG